MQGRKPLHSLSSPAETLEKMPPKASSAQTTEPAAPSRSLRQEEVGVGETCGLQQEKVAEEVLTGEGDGRSHTDHTVASTSAAEVNL